MCGGGVILQYLQNTPQVEAMQNFENKKDFIMKHNEFFVNIQIELLFALLTSCCLKYLDDSNFVRISLSRTSNLCRTSSRSPRNNEMASNTCSLLFTHLRSDMGAEPRNCQNTQRLDLNELNPHGKEKDEWKKEDLQTKEI